MLEEGKHRRTRNDPVSVSFTLLDIARMVMGILLLNAFLSFWFTSSTVWGYDGKLLNPQYLKFKTFGSYLNLSVEELSLFNGSDPKLPIYIAIGGRIYDVSSSSKIYGVGNSYNKFSGKDASRVFHTGCLYKEDEYTYDLRGLDEEKAWKDIHQWQNYYDNHKKYWYVGTVQHKTLRGDPPSPCINTMKYHQ
ncbi:hypothetical protein PACTADRAFT_3242 [Pachysolen tannophilus NRRL Y-2460]|uniref:Cytochrome b5 heme-binding domain-containing protein n=1 Tax=Pachysolen tannophilus NRRL Y-2460 TaxID=669874 RepID=A0A1E4TUY7_PACTA|nr:hypothetical protein PACTADRAFT_3242 [Pachysolen tannophilus NRRL Y-2460]